MISRMRLFRTAKHYDDTRDYKRNSINSPTSYKRPKYHEEPIKPRYDEEAEKALEELRQRLAAQTEIRRRLEEEHDKELDQRMADLRRERRKREEEESKMMKEREQLITSLVTNSSTKQRLLPTEEQSANIQAFIKAQALGFEVQNKHSAILDRIQHCKKLQKELDHENNQLNEEYLTQRDYGHIRDDTDQQIHDLRLKKEMLKRELERKVEDVKQSRLAAGGGSSKTMVDLNVEKELKGVDSLMMVKLLELKREKSKLEDLQNQYEEYLFEQEKERTEKNKKDPNNKLCSIQPSSLLPIITQDTYRSDLAASGMSGSRTPSHLRSHFIPAGPSELIQTPASKFLDEFNRDLDRLICRE